MSLGQKNNSYLSEISKTVIKEFFGYLRDQTKENKEIAELQTRVTQIEKENLEIKKQVEQETTELKKENLEVKDQIGNLQSGVLLLGGLTICTLSYIIFGRVPKEAEKLVNQ